MTARKREEKFKEKKMKKSNVRARKRYLKCDKEPKK